ncbi:ATP-binding protein [Shewanella gelidimarina]|uniref:ATP-binding protein n=1 Tax=Shewanella gelidimarina TaxID=56813 RepID=UPI002010A69C|nr:ATP-binding protein [Shewanella gelidimarina]MCL1059604.1 ATP-binding protein [Shewanella gelidimarina]
MANYLPPLFTRLYLSLLTALFASIVLTLYLSEQFLEQSDVVDFYDDSYQTFIEVTSGVSRTHLSAPQYITSVQGLHPQFDINWQANWNAKQDCSECTLLSNIGGISIYQLSEAQLLAIYPLDRTNGAILISDRLPNSLLFDESNRQHRSSFMALLRDDPSELIPYLLLLVVIITIGTTLYFSVRRLQKQINQLVDTNKKFGQGDLNIRARQTYSEPVNELADSFNRMADAITETVKENQVFAQAVPHEMRTPLSRIQLATGLLRQRSLQTEELDLLDDIDNYIDDIEKLTRQVLTFSKLNSVLNQKDNQTKQWIKLDEYLQSRIKLLATDNRIMVNSNLPSLQLECDPAYLRLMFDNLFKNALMYASSQVEVTLSFSRKESKTRLLIISVDDDGPGIDSQQFETIFLPFARLDKSRSQQTGGLGLGLAIAKAAARRMQGTLVVSRSLLGGANFSCQLPYHPNQQQD